MAFLLIIGVSAWWSERKYAQTIHWVEHTHQVSDQIDEVLVNTLNLAMESRNYALTGQEKHIQSYQNGVVAVHDSLAVLKQLTQDNPPQLQRLAGMEELIQKRISYSDEVINLRRNGEQVSAIELMATGRGARLMDEIRGAMADIKDVEQLLLKQRKAEAQDAGNTLWTIVALGCLLSIGLVVTSSIIVQRDFEKRQQAEDALRLSEQNLAVTLHSIGDAVLATDIEGRVTRLNPVAEKLTGWTQAEAMGLPISEIFRIINEETRQPAVIPVDDVLRSGEIHGLANHTVIIARDGTERPIADSAAPIRDLDGRLLGVVLVFRDVTDEHAAQRALRESEARYRTLFDSMDEGYCIIEMMFDENDSPLDYRFLEINPSFEKQTGLRDAIGKRMRELAPKHEEHWFEIYGRIAVTGEPIRFQNRAEQLNRTYDVFAFRFGDPKNRQVAILFNDISARQQMEEDLRRSEQNLSVTLHSIGDAVLATDIQGRITRLNPVAEKLVGWTQAEAIGRPVAEVFHIINEDTRAPAVIPVEKVLATGEIHGLTNHTVLISRNGVEYPIADSAAAIRDQDGRVIGVVLVFRDVTEERRSEKAIRESERRLSAINEELERRVTERTTEMRQALATLDATEVGTFIFGPDAL